LDQIFYELAGRKVEVFSSGQTITSDGSEMLLWAED